MLAWGACTTVLQIWIDCEGAWNPRVIGLTWSIEIWQSKYYYSDECLCMCTARGSYVPSSLRACTRLSNMQSILKLIGSKFIICNTLIPNPHCSHSLVGLFERTGVRVHHQQGRAGWASCIANELCHHHAALHLVHDGDSIWETMFQIKHRVVSLLVRGSCRSPETSFNVIYYRYPAEFRGRARYDPLYICDHLRSQSIHYNLKIRIWISISVISSRPQCTTSLARPCGVHSSWSNPIGGTTFVIVGIS